MFKLTIVVCSSLLFAASASANSVTMELAGGATSANFTSAQISSTFTVTMFALLGPTGGGTIDVNAYISYNPSVVTATACAETPTFSQGVIGAAQWAPATVNCGKRNPADGGLAGPVGIVEIIDQSNNLIGPAGSSGKLKLGTVTFHLTGAPGTANIDSFFAPVGVGGFLGQDFINRTNFPTGGVNVTVIPEPATVALIGCGLLSLSIAGRSRRRRT